MSLSVLRPTAVLLSRCTGAEPETMCTCGSASLLAYVMGGYRHVGICLACLGKTHCEAPDRHVACTDPTPVLCLHRSGGCGQPVVLETPCAHRTGPCCGCCWRDEGVSRARP